MILLKLPPPSRPKDLVFPLRCFARDAKDGQFIDPPSPSQPLAIENTQPWADIQTVTYTSLDPTATSQPWAVARQKASPACSVTFVQGRVDFCGVVTYPDLTFLCFEGSSFQGPDTEVEVFKTSGLANPHLTRLNDFTVEPTTTPASEPQTVTHQAMILGAGIATRFEPVTGQTTGYSKPTVPLTGTDSVIMTLAKQLELHGIRNVVVNTYYKPEQLKAQLNHVAQHSTNQLHFHYVDEHEPSGTAGGMAKALEQGLIDQTQPVLVVLGDAVTDVDFTYLLKAHQQHHAALTIGGQIVTDEDVHRFGIIETDHSGQDGQSGHICGFKEKPSLADAGTSRFANTGFYVIDPILFPLFLEVYHQTLSEGRLYDYACDFFPAVLKRLNTSALVHPQTQQPMTVWAQALTGYWSDIGCPHQYLYTLADLDEGRLQWPKPSDWPTFYQNGVVHWPGSLNHPRLEGLTLSGPIIITPTLTTP